MHDVVDARYQNHQHYLSEGWSREPKESFKALGQIVERKHGLSELDVLDVGAATGEFLAYFRTIAPQSRLVGVEVAPELVKEARRRLPSARFVEASALALPSDLHARFDLVTAIGCMSIFDDSELEAFWDNLLAAAKPDGYVIVLAPLNEFGVDAIIRHRKRPEGKPAPWECGWNIYSIDTVSDLLEARSVSVEFIRFELPFELRPKADPIRSWTMRTQDRAFQLTNGLKLLIDHYFVVAERSA